MILLLIVSFNNDMEGTYFSIVPAELIDIITYKLSLTFDLYAYIEAIGLNKPKTFYKLSITLCDYLKDIPFECKVGYNLISWERVYGKLLCMVAPVFKRLFKYSSTGLIHARISDTIITTTISRHFLFDNLGIKCNDLVLCLFYKFGLSKVEDRPRLSAVLYDIIKRNYLHMYNVTKFITDVIDYRKNYADVIISTSKKISNGVYMDKYGFSITSHDGVYDEDILALYCDADPYNGNFIRLTDNQIQQAKVLGYTLY